MSLRLGLLLGQSKACDDIALVVTDTRQLDDHEAVIMRSEDVCVSLCAKGSLS